MPAMLHRLYLTLAFALFFALGQQGAAMHAVAHYADWQGEQHEKSQHGKQACEQCVVYAKLAHAAPGHTPPALPAASSYQLPDAAAFDPRSVTAQHFQARGPPSSS